MLFFNKKTTIASSGILQGAADHHSHILPGVDDGVETMDEALHILSRYEELGIKRLWLTPHVMEEIPNTPAKLKERFAELQAAYTGSIELHLAAEYMLDSNLSKLLNNNNSPSSKREHPQGEGVGNLLPIGTKGNHLLVETSYFNPPMRLHQTLEQIGSLGYHPPLAHPERYMYMDESDYRQLHQKGAKFQLNLASLAGGYGSVVKKKAQWLLQNSYYTICGSDLHCEDAIELITKCKLGEKEMAQVKLLLQNSI
mgnify:CR=1 FL=1